MQARMNPSFWAVKRSRRTMQEAPKVKREEVELRMVLEVTDVLDRLRLKVHCARNHSGATCTSTHAICHLV